MRLSRFLQIPKEDRINILNELDTSKITLVEIIAYCFMPNHFHLLLKQRLDGGISLFMKKITDSYTRYYNTKNKRVGPVFQGAFKAIHVSSEEQLLHLSRYIHINPLVSAVVRESEFMTYPWSSLHDYAGGIPSSFVSTEPVLQHFRSPQEYIQFVVDRIEYGIRLEEIKHITLE